MDRIEELLELANPVRPSNGPRLDAGVELRAALDGSSAMDAAGQDFYQKDVSRTLWRRPVRRPWAVAIAVAIVSALVAAVVVLTQALAPLQPPPPAVTPFPSISNTETGPSGWRVVRMSTPAVTGTTGPQIQVDVAPGFVAMADSPNESYDSLSVKIVSDGAAEGVFAQIYYGQVLPQRDPKACAAAPETYVELDSVPVDVPFDASTPGTSAPRFVYRVVTGTTLRASFGITYLPPGTAVDACTEFHHLDSLPVGTVLVVSDQYLFSGQAPGWLSTVPNSLSPTFASVDEARAFMNTDEYRTYKRMLASVRIIRP